MPGPRSASAVLILWKERRLSVRRAFLMRGCSRDRRRSRLVAPWACIDVPCLHRDFGVDRRGSFLGKQWQMQNR